MWNEGIILISRCFQRSPTWYRISIL